MDDSIILWNVILSLVVAPLLWTIRSNISDVKRLDILLNKTREELGRDYISRTTFEKDLNRITRLLEKLEQKIEKQHLVLGSKIDQWLVNCNKCPLIEK